MSTDAMEEPKDSDYESQSQTLRAELKKWESDWAKAHGGNKPTRSDIKQNRDIAHKYKQYNRFRDILAGKHVPSGQDGGDRRKRIPNDAALSNTTPERPKTVQTPSKAHSFAQDFATAITPSQCGKLFSPTLPTSIGPTPQKDGRVLGLFDLLAGTPSRSTSHATVLGAPDPTQGTPSKRVNSRSEDLELQHPCGTPGSGSKRARRDSCTTPRHSRDGNARPVLGDASAPELSSVPKVQFATPAFLRRTCTVPPPPVDENGEWKVEPIRLPRKAHGRGLSSVVASLRRLEEETMDEQLDIMREMDAENEAGPSTLVLPGVAKQVPKLLATDKPAMPRPPARRASGVDPTVEVPDSQARPALLGAFDNEALYDSSEGEEVVRNGQPLRVFKKRGQKRTTRKVNIKPTRTKRPAQLEKTDLDLGCEDTRVPEMQLAGSSCNSSDPLDLGADAAVDEPNFEDHANDFSKPLKRSRDESLLEPTDGPVQKVMRKVKATAHANFRRLKLRNNGARGGPGYNSRFRRRR